MSLTGVVFDFDGTMVDTESAVFGSVAQVWATHGLELAPERWMPYIGSAESFDWLGELDARVGPLDRIAVQAEWMEVLMDLSAQAPMRPGVLALLDDCSAQGIPMAVASNAPRAWLEVQLGSRGLWERFDAVVAVDDVPAAKPAPDVYLAAVDALGVDPEGVVAIEDSPTGVASARAAGLACIGVPAGLSAAMDLSAATWVLPDLTDLTVAGLTDLLAASTRSGSG